MKWEIFFGGEKKFEKNPKSESCLKLPEQLDGRTTLQSDKKSCSLQQQDATKKERLHVFPAIKSSCKRCKQVQTGCQKLISVCVVLLAGNVDGGALCGERTFRKVKQRTIRPLQGRWILLTWRSDFGLSLHHRVGGHNLVSPALREYIQLQLLSFKVRME